MGIEKIVVGGQFLSKIYKILLILNLFEELGLKFYVVHFSLNDIIIKNY